MCVANRTASVRREIQHLDGLGELLALVHGPNRAAVSVARLEAMRTIANLSVTGADLRPPEGLRPGGVLAD